MKLRTFILISFISFATFALAVKLSWQVNSPLSEEAIAGKEVWQKNNCISCHTLLGNGGYVGGDLTQVMSRLSSDAIIGFFKNPPLIPPSQEKMHIYLPEKEAQAVMAYLRYFEDIPTLGWPPCPGIERNFFQGGLNPH